MANWKKVVVSGSSAELSALTLDTSLASGSGGTGLTKSDLAAASAGQVLAIKSDLSGFTLATATSGDVQAIITPSNSGLSITDTSDADGNVAITMSISTLSAQNTLASGDTFAFDDISDTTSVVTTKKVTLDALSGSIISGISGDVDVTAAGVAAITDAATGSILSTLSGDVTSTVAGVASLATSVGVLGTNQFTGSFKGSLDGDLSLTDASIFVGNVSGVATGVALSGDATITNAGVLTIADAATGSILSTISGDVSVDAGGVSTLATSVGVLGTNQFTGSFKGSLDGDLSLTDASIFVGNVSGVATGVALSGDATITNAGVLTIADAATGSILSTISGDVSVDAGGVSSLANSITIAENLTVNGNLNVAGTASFTNATNLAVSDKYILLNSGSGQADDSGGIIIQGPNQDIGQLFGFSSGSDKRWGVDSSFNADSAAGFTPEAFMSAVLPAGTATTQTTIAAINTKYNKNGNIYTTDDSNGNEIWIYA